MLMTVQLHPKKSVRIAVKAILTDKIYSCGKLAKFSLMTSSDKL